MTSPQALVLLRNDILDGVREVILERLPAGRLPAEIDADAALFGAGLGLDSVDAVDLVLGLEDRFGVQLPDGERSYRALRTVGGIVDFVVAATADAGTTPARRTLPGPAVAPGRTSEAFEADPLQAEVAAIRTRIGWLVSDHVRLIEVRGPGDTALIDQLLPTTLYLREGELKATLVLDEAGRPWADVLVGRDDRGYRLLCEARAPAAAAERIRALVSNADTVVVDRSLDHAVVSLHGPWAWELAAELVDPIVVGIEYLGYLSTGGLECLRTGKTGEYGYDLIVPRRDLAALVARLEAMVTAYEGRTVSVEALDRCAIENGFFTVRASALLDYTPDELGLAWRTSHAKRHFVGAEALRSRRTAGLRGRLTTIIATHPFSTGDAIALDGRTIGEVLHAFRSPDLDRTVGWAMLEPALAAAGIDQYRALTKTGEVALCTVTPPLVDNLSLRVDPTYHSFREARLP